MRLVQRETLRRYIIIITHSSSNSRCRTRTMCSVRRRMGLVEGDVRQSFSQTFGDGCLTVTGHRMGKSTWACMASSRHRRWQTLQTRWLMDRRSSSRRVIIPEELGPGDIRRELRSRGRPAGRQLRDPVFSHLFIFSFLIYVIGRVNGVDLFVKDLFNLLKTAVLPCQTSSCCGSASITRSIVPGSRHCIPLFCHPC